MKMPPHRYVVLDKVPGATKEGQKDMEDFLTMITGDWRIAAISVVEDKIHYLLRKDGILPPPSPSKTEKNQEKIAEVLDTLMGKKEPWQGQS